MRTAIKSYLRYGGLLLATLIFIAGLSQKSFVMAASVTSGTVTASSLNVRKSASSGSTSLGKIQKGTQVKIKGTKKDSAKNIWYQITTLISEKTVEGFVHSDYVDKNVEHAYVKRTGVTNATRLNIRKSMSTSSTSLALVPKGTVVTVVGEKTVSGTKWVKLNLTVNGKSITGYTHSTYVTRDDITCETNQYLFGVAKKDNVVAYSKANTYTKIKAKLAKNQEVVILGMMNVRGTSWLKVKIKMNASNVYGYVKASDVIKQTATVKATEKLKGHITTNTAAYKIASVVSKKIKNISVGQEVIVKGKITVNNTKWNLCTFKVSGKSYTAYVKESCIQLDSDAQFEQSILQFPESYRPHLRELHAKYPNWTFTPVYTGLDWNTVIENECRVGRNTIQSNVPKGGSVTSYSAPFSYLSTAPGAYDWATDKYTLIDGSNWYTASREVIEYYMDPRNSLTEEQIFQFEALAYDSNQDISVVKKILENTFMSGTYTCLDKITNETINGTYSKTFMEAGKQSGASPYFLAARAKQELGPNGSGSVSGQYKGYEGIYNFFNIGAFDSSTGQAIANGLKWASTGTTFLRPWTNIEKAIYGGASYIASSYINKGQNTLYLQKFNVVYAPLFSHQYMTNVMAPRSEARTQYDSYKSMGVMDSAYAFYIPVYNNMPKSVCKLPQVSGNPNSFLKSLNVMYGKKQLSLTPTFSYQTTLYTMVVDANVEEVTITGAPVSVHGTINGLGTYTLEKGKTKTIPITCIAGNGTKTTYTLKVSRLNE